MGQIRDMDRLQVIDGWKHDTSPDPRTIRSTVTGEPASMLTTRPAEYPLAAECRRCGRPIRLESWSLLADWEHDDPRPPEPRRPT